MPKMPEKLEDIPRKVQLHIINKAKNRIKDSDVIKDMFKEWDVESEVLDLIPVCFSDDLDVSARTDHAIIYINYDLIKDCEDMEEMLESIDHYLVHEITHYCQQCYGDKPTQGSEDGDYLANEFEQEGFQNQTEYISDTQGDEEAEEYVEDLLDHHDIEGKKEREKRKDQLLSIAARRK